MKLDILAFGAHPDDVEMGCGGTLAKSTSMGKSVGIIDLTKGELGTNGSPEERDKEASQSAKILGVKFRENMGFEDGFLVNDKSNQIEIVKKYDKENNVLKSAPHTAYVVTSSSWDQPYTREKAAYPLPFVSEKKFWPAVGRVDNAHGDRNLFCSCVPLEAYSS